MKSSLLTLGFCVLAALTDIAAPLDYYFMFETYGRDCYADGTPLMEKECYALIWRHNDITNQVDGLFYGDGTPVDPAKCELLWVFDSAVRDESSGSPVAHSARDYIGINPIHLSTKGKEGVYSLFVFDTRVRKSEAWELGGKTSYTSVAALNSYGVVTDLGTLTTLKTLPSEKGFFTWDTLRHGESFTNDDTKVSYGDESENYSCTDHPALFGLFANADGVAVYAVPDCQGRIVCTADVKGFAEGVFAKSSIRSLELESSALALPLNAFVKGTTANFGVDIAVKSAGALSPAVAFVGSDSKVYQTLSDAFAAGCASVTAAVEMPTYTVTYKANGGTGADETVTNAFFTPYTIAANPFKNGDLNFNGWAREPDGPAVYHPGTAVTDLTDTLGEDVPLYAVWTDDLPFRADVANTYDGCLVKDGELIGLVQVKTAKQSVKKGVTNITVTATVTDAKGKKWSYSKGGATVDGLVTNLVCTKAGCPVASFGVSLGRNSMDGAYGEVAEVSGRRNGMGDKYDEMTEMLKAYLGKWSVTVDDGVSILRAQLNIQAKGVVKVAGNWEDGKKLSASTQLLMQNGYVTVPLLVAESKTTHGTALLLKLTPAGEVALASGGELVAGGRTTPVVGVAEYVGAYTMKAGEVYSARVAIAELAYPAKFTAKKLPDGLKIDTATGVVSGQPKKPGIYDAVELTAKSAMNAKSNSTLAVSLKVENYTNANIRIEDAYGPFVPGVTVNFPIKAADGCAVSGLPSGMKWKDGAVTGAPTKPGNYTVYFKKTVDGVQCTATATFIVGPFPVLLLETCGEGSGNVKGAGAFAANKKVSLKATADSKDTATTVKSVFAGWFIDAACKDPVVGANADYRNPSLSYVMPAATTNTLYARFAPAADDADISLAIDGQPVTDKASDLLLTVRGTTNLPLTVGSVSLPKVSLSKLPAGLKFDSKMNVITGNPTKPGVYTITAKLTNASIKNAIVRAFTIKVPNLTEANGCFETAPDTIGAYPLAVGVSDLRCLPELALVSPTAKLTVSGLPSGIKYDAKTGAWSGIATKAGSYTVYLTVTEGRTKFVTTITVEVAGLPAWAIGNYDGWYLSECATNGTFSATVSKAGKVSGKTTGSLATKYEEGAFSEAYTNALGQIERYRVEVVVKYKVGTISYQTTNDLFVSEDPDTGLGVISGAYAEGCEAYAVQRAWDRKDLAMPAFVTGKAAPQYTNAVDGLILKFDAKGVVTVSGVLPKIDGSGTASVSAKAQVLPMAWILEPGTGKRLALAAQVFVFISEKAGQYEAFAKVYEVVLKLGADGKFVEALPAETF